MGVPTLTRVGKVHQARVTNSLQSTIKGENGEPLLTEFSTFNREDYIEKALELSREGGSRLSELRCTLREAHLRACSGNDGPGTVSLGSLGGSFSQALFEGLFPSSDV